ncbi:calcium-binding protein [Actinobacillus suis]|uniref:Ig family protein n=2 Tax=Actinobacillus suis TaxID=716 RepID=K0G2H5_ACTSU|nr:calcium-binding protein [Actinobacillus suis]AFU18461.1 Ig family protein [Actinobacillus suis H91-0380]AIJ30597.1 Ig family protein [Actinobacillus suis ATCC 33415]MCO4167277.1 calcium-binding protein [Actinobacillus suis]MCO4169089.1 calcium-binding protein [Actinobacillus suis]MCQ9630028.1 calcium-binding protein [Actinobacillus suis]
MAFDIFNYWGNFDPIRPNRPVVDESNDPVGPVQLLQQFVIDDDQATLVLINEWVAPPSYRDRIVFDDISGGRLLLVNNDGSYREINDSDNNNWAFRELRNTEHNRLYFLPDNPSSEDTRIHVKLHVEPNNSNVVDVHDVYNTNYSIHFDVQDIASSSPVKFGTDYADSLYGTRESDTIHGLNGNDFIMGEAGDDVITGGAGNDRLLGGYGDDTLYGSEGADWLNGGNGNDFLYGGAGNDTYYFYKGAGRDEIFDVEGENTLQFANGIRPQDITIDATTNDLGNVSWHIRVNGTDDQVFIYDQYSNGGKTIGVNKFIFGNDFFTTEEISDMFGLPEVPVLEAENPEPNFVIEVAGYNDLMIPIAEISPITYPEYANSFMF